MAMARMTQTRRPRRPKRRKRIASPKRCRRRNHTNLLTERPNSRLFPPLDGPPWLDFSVMPVTA